MNKFYEFFAGGGMARTGLGEGWKCLFANDFDHKKASSYRKNWGGSDLVVDDIRKLSISDFPEIADLVWASFPCQDLSLAGGGAGLKGNRSGTFWPFMDHIHDLSEDGRQPNIITLENVVGTLTSHKGQDFAAICQSLKEKGYIYGAIVVDAALFVPQSRPRLFIVALKKGLYPCSSITKPNPKWHTKTLQKAFDVLSDDLKDSWVWWDMPAPPKRTQKLVDIIEDNPVSTKWHNASETRALLSMMSDVNLAKVETAKASGIKMVGGVYKRTRYQHGIKVQRAEVRFDDKAGCLRTPAGGSSRQLILVVEGQKMRSRLLSTRETARLMGLPDSYFLPNTYNEAYHLTGDGVAVPVVRHIAKHILEPLIELSKGQTGNIISMTQKALKNNIKHKASSARGA